MTEDLSALTLTVHTPPAPEVDAVSRRTASGRLRMLLVLLVCAAPVVASYLAYFVIRPERRNNYSELIAPPRPLSAGSTFTDLQGHPVASGTLKGQWLLVVVAGGACDAICERHLWIQRQLRESLGRDSDRVDKVWLIDDAAAPRRETLDAVREGSAPATVLRAPPATIARWLEPAPGARIEDHIYIVDPRGEWMMRVPRDPDPAGLKRDIEKLLRASTGWDRPGR